MYGRKVSIFYFTLTVIVTAAFFTDGLYSLPSLLLQTVFLEDDGILEYLSGKTKPD